MGHLKELRSCLLRSVIALLVALPIAFFATKYVFDMLMKPVPGVHLIYTEITEMLGTYAEGSTCYFSHFDTTVPCLSTGNVCPACTHQARKKLCLHHAAGDIHMFFDWRRFCLFRPGATGLKFSIHIRQRYRRTYDKSGKLCHGSNLITFLDRDMFRDSNCHILFIQNWRCTTSLVIKISQSSHHPGFCYRGRCHTDARSS